MSSLQRRVERLEAGAAQGMGFLFAICEPGESADEALARAAGGRPLSEFATLMVLDFVTSLPHGQRTAPAGPVPA